LYTENTNLNGSISMGTKRDIATTRKSLTGFTIVELLIVVVVIAILAAITIVAYNGITQRANETALKSSIKQASTSIDLYKVDNSAYPGSLAILNINQVLYGNPSLLWAYTTTTSEYCISIGSTSSTAKFHIADENGTIEDGICPEHTVAMLTNESGGGSTPVATYPSRGGFSDISANTFAGDNTEVTIGAVPTGAWMIVVLAYPNYEDPAPPVGWTTIMPRHVSGSLNTSIYAKIKQSGDSSQQLFNGPGSGGETTMNGAFIWGENAAPLNSWIIGSAGDRANNATSTTSVTPTVTTTVAKSLVIGVAAERTIAAETNYTSITGATAWGWVPHVGGSRIQSIAIGYQEKDAPGTTQAMTVTYPNSQAANGMGIQIAIPPAS
jgi:prepilin-type N-terminal cleavage/methylation domain-containing protein